MPKYIIKYKNIEGVVDTLPMTSVDKRKASENFAKLYPACVIESIKTQTNEEA